MEVMANFSRWIAFGNHLLDRPNQPFDPIDLRHYCRVVDIVVNPGVGPRYAFVIPETVYRNVAMILLRTNFRYRIYPSKEMMTGVK